MGRHGPRRLAAALFVLGAVALAACQFNPGQLTPGDGGVMPDADPDAPDADVTLPIDANPNAPDAVPCAWMFAPEYVDPCADGKPDPDVDLILDDGDSYIYDTTTGAFVDFTPPAGVVTTDEDGVHTLWVRNFTLEDSVTLRVRGDRPLMIVASEELRVRGTIDASSSWNNGNESYDRGPGLEPSECSSNAAEIGGSCVHGGAGGGGGGFGGAGGRGGDGGDGRGCPDGSSPSAPGGAGGSAAAVPTEIRAGCDGARGGNGDEDGWYGVGGAGGGAVHLVARVQVRVEGTIHAGGAGGDRARDKRAGGGGGGSGGFIGLEAPEIRIASEAVIAANGGGGGGGTSGLGGGASGADGLADDVAATGGGGHSNGNGGDGSDVDTFDGATGGNGDRGGGGGGGGAGFIVFYQSQPTLDGTPVISPAPTQR